MFCVEIKTTDRIEKEEVCIFRLTTFSLNHFISFTPDEYF